ncbi:MAG: NAD-dependent epimerase/dehydratase family protein [Bacteroidota bacterium]|nr:NAD-dependent epimerase/dehydratase family protein [Bacteroidota bacterium]MDP4214025.1 NAD-dependent epimerase/dehydratase family protein [Bacteroidota bacterium]MDP4250237.1 NAD-dependent epimerase/dehydratase family protein [Bacteroidota bacterium]
MIFLTGGTGFLGSYVLTELVQQGYAVRALRRENHPVPFYLSPELSEKVEWVSGDILDVVCLDEYMKGCHCIIHAAALVSFYPGDREKLWKVNIEGTANVVNAALENNIPDFIHISSVGALGRTNNAEMLNEEKKWESNSRQSQYAISKYYGEMEVWRGMGEGLTPVIVNPSTILGYGDWNQGSCAIFKTAYQEFPWYVNGSNGFVDVEDLARVIALLMKSPVRNDRFIVSGENWDYRHLFNCIADGFHKNHPSKEATPFLAGLAWRAEKFKSLFNGKKPMLTRETAAIARRKSVYDNSKLLKALTGFQFTPIEDSIRNACSRYLKNIQPG